MIAFIKHPFCINTMCKSGDLLLTATLRGHCAELRVKFKNEGQRATNHYLAITNIKIDNYTR